MNNLFCHQILLLCCVLIQVKAQTPQDQPNVSTQKDSNFEPSLAIVMGILSAVFFLTCILLIYAKCSMGASIHNDPEDHHPVLTRSGSRFSGIDKTVVESLPFFRFSSLKGSKEGLECAVCISKFEDYEILRLLPRCKHAFHMNCIDHWLDQHSSCPLCRQRISREDVEVFTYSSSMRLIDHLDKPEEESNIEIFVQREEEENGNCRFSSRFTIGSSFRRLFKTKDDGKSGNNEAVDGNSKMLHKFNHKIFVSDFVLKHRWSNVSSSDLMFLNSEMLNSASSNRFSALESNNPEKVIIATKVNEPAHEHVRKIKEEMDRKFFIESKFITPYKDHDSIPISSNPNMVDAELGCSDHYETEFAVSNGRRSMSDIAGVARFGGLNVKNRCEEPCLDGVSSNTKEERLRKLWLPIVRRTVQWLANRERKSHASQDTSQLPNV